MHHPTSLFLLRHAEVEDRYHRTFGGRIDMELSPRGHEQAAALASYVRRLDFQALYASPMKRAQQTLAPVAAACGLKPAVVSEFCEVDFGDWTGLNFTQVQTQFNAHAYQWLDFLERDAIPNAEGDGRLRTRIEPGLRQILARHPQQRVAILCHGGVIRVMLSILLALPLSKMAMFDIDYASLTHVDLAPPRVEVQLLNFAPWRDVP